MPHPGRPEIILIGALIAAIHFILIVSVAREFQSRYWAKEFRDRAAVTTSEPRPPWTIGAAQ